MDKDELNEIYLRLHKILNNKKGIKKTIAGQYVYGFLVALCDYKVITFEEYQKIRNLLVKDFGYFA